MKCKCGGTTLVTTTKQIPEGIFRRRKCSVCKEIIATLESEVSTPGSGRYTKEGTRKPKTLPKPDNQGLYTKPDVKIIKAQKVETRRKNEDRKARVPSYFIEEEDW